MSIVLKRIYSIWGMLAFMFTFLVLCIPFLVIIQIKPWHKYTALLNRIWTNMFFMLLGMPVKIVRHSAISKNESYVYCPNHFSYLDIPSMGFTSSNFVFVGKNDMEKVPLFGYMYKNLHITVNRGSLKSKHNTYVRAKLAIDEGRSLVLFPEGGVLTQSPPQMSNFKNGAFKLAIEKQIAIVPVTIPHNWILLPDDDRFLLNWGVMKVVYHEPIATKGLTLSDMEALKQKVYNVIQAELDKNDYR